MVSISIYWTVCSASLMTTRRQIECNASNCIHKHFYRTSNPWAIIVLDIENKPCFIVDDILHDQMAATGKVKRSNVNDLPQGVERLKEEHRKVRSNVYFIYHQCIPADIKTQCSCTRSIISTNLIYVIYLCCFCSIVA